MPEWCSSIGRPTSPHILKQWRPIRRRARRSSLSAQRSWKLHRSAMSFGLSAPVSTHSAAFPEVAVARVLELKGADLIDSQLAYADTSGSAPGCDANRATP